MRRVILKMSVSVDGFVGGPNGEIDWLFRSTDEGAVRWIMDALRQAGVHIMGSRTFRDMAAYWPFSNEPFAAPMNEIPKVVFSRKGLSAAQNTTALRDASAARPIAREQDAARQASWVAARVASGDLADEIARLKQEPGNDILAHGGASFVQSLTALGLVDEYRLLVHPVVLGRGLGLFSALPKPADLRLISSTAFGAGAVGNVYRPA